jgi:hypothetical protein
MPDKLTPANIVIIASGFVVLVFSLFEFFDGSDAAIFGDGLFPFTTLVVLAGIAMAVVVVLKAFANVSLPAQIAGFSWPQIHFVLAGLAMFIMLGYLFDGDASKAFGFWLMLLGTIGLVVGSVMLMREEGVVGADGTAPGYGQPPGGYPPPGPPGYGGPGQPPTQF